MSEVTEEEQGNCEAIVTGVSARISEGATDSFMESVYSTHPNGTTWPMVCKLCRGSGAYTCNWGGGGGGSFGS